MTAELVPVRTEAPRFEDIVETYLARDYIRRANSPKASSMKPAPFKDFYCHSAAFAALVTQGGHSSSPKSQAAVCDRTTHGALI